MGFFGKVWSSVKRVGTTIGKKVIHPIAKTIGKTISTGHDLINKLRRYKIARNILDRIGKTQVLGWSINDIGKGLVTVGKVADSVARLTDGRKITVKEALREGGEISQAIRENRKK